MELLLLLILLAIPGGLGLIVFAGALTILIPIISFLAIVLLVLVVQLLHIHTLVVILAALIWVSFVAMAAWAIIVRIWPQIAQKPPSIGFEQPSGATASARHD